MFDTSSQHRPAAGRHQRIDAEAEVGLRHDGRATRLDRLWQRGSARALLPRCHGGPPEVVFLNTAGGLTGGDRIRYGLDLGHGGTATATTQTAERVYASLGDAADVSVRMRAGAGACLHWLPQETILFDRARLARRTEIELGRDATLLTVEMLVLGRAAMGETVAQAEVSDWRDVRRDGRPVLIDPLRLTGEVLAGRERPALLGGARAMALLALVAPGAEDRTEAARACIAAESAAGTCAAASGWDGRLVVRALAAEAQPLRRLVARLLVTLGAAALPRVWPT